MRELSTWWKTLSAAHRQPFWHAKRTIGGAAGHLVDMEALTMRHVTCAVPGTGEALYALVHGGRARRDDEQAAW